MVLGMAKRRKVSRKRRSPAKKRKSTIKKSRRTPIKYKTKSKKQKKSNTLVWIFILILAMAVFLQMRSLTPGEKEGEIKCNPPYSLINNNCCIDSEKNGICDINEIPTIIKEDIYTEETYPKSSHTFSVKSISTYPNSDPVLLGGEVGADDDPKLGNEDAPVVVIEFGNYKCIPCTQAYKYVLPQLKKNYIDTGKVLYVFRDFVYGAYSIDAEFTAITANCAREQGKFWEMHSLLYTSTKKFTRPEMINHAKKLKLDLSQFNTCLDKGYKNELREDYRDGKAATIKAGVPVFFINGYKLSTSDYDRIKDTIDNVLEGTWE